MIPLKIQIKNFLSYGADLQTVDFSHYHLVCLSGKNGHGKSALLDAITWAIWGQARKVAGAVKADQGLLRLGQTHMLVILDFICQGTHYRIRREFAVTHGKPYTALDFAIIDASTDTVNSLTEKTIRGTQKKIEDTIHLDYDTFTNSAFLRQGQANEFCKKSPKDRKDILATILGLQRYETMRKCANEKARAAMAQEQHLKAGQEKIEEALAQTDAIKEKQTEVHAQLAAQKKAQEALHKTLQRCTEQQQTFKQKELEAQQIEKRIQTEQQAQEKKRAQLRALVHSWRTTHRSLLALDDPAKLKEKKNQLAKTITSFQQQLKEQLANKERYLTTQQKLHTHQHMLEQQQFKALQEAQLTTQRTLMLSQQYEQQLKQLKEQEQKHMRALADYKKEIATLEAQLPKKEENRLAHNKAFFEKRRAHYQQWITQANMLQQEIKSLEHKQLLTQDADAPSCPLCEQNLSASRKKLLKNKLSLSAHTLQRRYQRLAAIITKLKPMLIEQHNAIQTLEKAQQKKELVKHSIQQLMQQMHKEQTAYTTCQQQLAATHKALEENRTAEQAAQKKYKAQEEAHKQQIAQDAALQQLQKELAAYKKAYEAHTYNQKAHEQAEHELREVEHILQSIDSLQAEAHKQESKKEQVHQLCQELKSIAQELAALTQKMKSFAHLAQELKTLEAQIATHTAEQAQHNKQREQLLQEKGRLEQQLTTLATLRAEHTKQNKVITELHKNIET